jgi:hypothetical protein
MLKVTSGSGDIRTHHPESRGATISTRSTVIVIWYLRPPFLGPSPLNIGQDSWTLFEEKEGVLLSLVCEEQEEVLCLLSLHKLGE